MMVGTHGCMSPEQAQAQSLDARSDIFTVGLIFYELLTGRMPYEADSAVASLLKRSRERGSGFEAMITAIPRSSVSLSPSAWKPDPKLRYQSAAEALADLENWHAAGAAATLRFPMCDLWAMRYSVCQW